MQREPESPKDTTKENEKKPWQTPRLIKHGTIEQITGQTLVVVRNGISGVLDGDADADAGAFDDGTISSRRYKENIKAMEGALEKVERLRGVSVDWKASGKHDIGLIAEEVGAVVPEVVAYEVNGQDAKGVDYARLTALLIEAVKEQQTQIQQLHSEMEELQAERHGVLASALR